MGLVSGIQFLVCLKNSQVFLPFLSQSVESVAISMRDSKDPAKIVRLVISLVLVRISAFLVAFGVPVLSLFHLMTRSWTTRNSKT